MADESFDNIRLSFMQDVLPVGIAMFERARQGGAEKLVEAFTKSTAPLEELRLEGEPAARSLRDRLDQVAPGLGNPVMSVNVAVENEESVDELSSFVENQEEEELAFVLTRIEARLHELEDCLIDHESHSDDLPLD
ncbi:hypothetical protein [Prochlorococcus sp. MIT 1300]|uniref:hypothetical protein n=1 Tax=Prochlorococcus sp. MIT 1300 TaxID=3096218 RepID=UPI002A75F2C1|nr:hypothetical protein [Prochlorococcus sp. MIT 1300]